MGVSHGLCRLVQVVVFVPSFSPAVAERIYAPVDAVIAGSGYATGKARNVPGGYRVTGQWKYASGAQYARVFTANAVLEGITRFVLLHSTDSRYL